MGNGSYIISIVRYYIIVPILLEVAHGLVIKPEICLIKLVLLVIVWFLHGEFVSNSCK